MMVNTDGTKLFCFPFAGAGPSFYSSWTSLGFDFFKIRPIAFPGRERLIAELPFTDLNHAVDYAYGQIITEDLSKPFALFGHCFLGSVIAWETSRRLIAAGRPPSHLFISASRAPSIRKYYGVKELADKDFIVLVKKITGYSHPAYDIPEMLDLIVPALRADFEMDESYSPIENYSIELPTTAFFANRDTSVSLNDIEKWREHCVGDFEIMELDGNHMYLAQDPVPLLNTIAAILTTQEGRK
ncbi:thioesterase II family protein [Pantoea cypripedii]|nr:thioesterase domain-containing protein [Pantoea cypripedii]MBP2195111.1 surfactin synthase thioesterase subunit [Pantoea cypripedii]